MSGDSVITWVNAPLLKQSTPPSIWLNYCRKLADLKETLHCWRVQCLVVTLTSLPHVPETCWWQETNRCGVFCYLVVIPQASQRLLTPGVNAFREKNTKSTWKPTLRSDLIVSWITTNTWKGRKVFTICIWLWIHIWKCTGKHYNQLVFWK